MWFTGSSYERTAQQLKNIIQAKGLNLGTTPNGADWCVKALHPSDPLTEVQGIPDQSSVPSLFMNFQTVANITPPTNATSTWSTEIQVFPHPIQFAAMSNHFSTGDVYQEVLNSQLTGTGHGVKYDSFCKQFKRWRLAYAGVTIYQDGPDLANQGTVVCCQKPVEVPEFSISMGSAPSLTRTTIGAFPAFNIDAADGRASYAASQAMPNAYFGRSREGVYVPLKLSENHQKWYSYADSMYQATSSAVTPLITAPDTPNPIGGQLIITGNLNPVAYGQYPFISLNDMHQYTSGVNVGIVGEPTANFCSQNWADICFKNMAVTTSLSLFFRYGFECQVVPTSLMAPHLKLSPAYDPAALSAYYAISRELKDGYPADFNDLGKIWAAIKEVANTLSPIVELIPGFGSSIVAGGKLAGKIGDRMVGALTRTAGPTQGSTASSADKALVQQCLHEAGVSSSGRQAKSGSPQRTKKQKKKKKQNRS